MSHIAYSAPTYYRDPHEPKRFRYIPGSPTPERSPDGRPTLQLWVTDNDARLQLGTQWALSSQEAATLRRTIATRFPEYRGDDIDLQPAPIRIERVELLLVEGKGERPVASSTSSGFVPYTALFTVALTGAQKADVLSALNGSAGKLSVRYFGEVLNEQGAWERIERTADIASWLRAGEAHNHIRVMPTTRLYPPDGNDKRSSAKVTFKVEERLSNAPIVFIVLEWGSANETMRAPTFAPVALPSAETPLRCTTNYSVGKRAYQVTLARPLAEVHVLGAESLGIAEVVISAPAYHEAGAREVRATVHYRPNGAGTEDERTIYLRNDTWEARWWLVTRAATLDGTLEVTAKVTYENGRTSNVPRFRQQEGTVSLSPDAVG